MSTFLLNPNDSLIINDSIVVKMTKATDACQTCVSETATNCNDVMIVLIICTAIVLVALIAKWALWSWKKTEYEHKKEEFKAKKKKEKEESERKLKVDCQNKLLEFLGKRMAAFDAQKYEKDYIEKLQSLIDNKKKEKETSNDTNSDVAFLEGEFKFLQKQIERLRTKEKESQFNTACQEYAKELNNIINKLQFSDESKKS